MAFAPKDISSLNILGQNLGQAVQNQFRNDLMAANMQRQQQQKEKVGGVLSSFQTLLNDPKATMDQKRTAKMDALTQLAGLGANDQADIVKSIELKDPETSFQYVEPKPGVQGGVFNSKTGVFTPSGTVTPAEPDYEPAGTVKRDGIIYKIKRPVDKLTRKPIENLPNVEEAWTQERDDNWFDRFTKMLDVKDRAKVSERVQDLRKKAADHEKNITYYQSMVDSPDAGLPGGSQEQIDAAKTKYRAGIQALQPQLDNVYQELTDIEKIYGGDMIRNPSVFTGGAAQPSAAGAAKSAGAPLQPGQKITWNDLRDSTIKHESGGNASIISKPNKDGTVDIGLFQINSRHITDQNTSEMFPAIKSAIESAGKKADTFEDRKQALLDPNINEAVAKIIFANQGIGGWSTSTKVLTDVLQNAGFSVSRDTSTAVAPSVAAPASTVPASMTAPTAAPADTGDAFTVAEIRAAYPQAVNGKTDQQIIDAYKKVGVIVKP